MAGDNSPAIFFTLRSPLPIPVSPSARGNGRLYMGEAPMTAGGGNLIGAEVNRKGALPRAVRVSRDYDSAVRARNITPRWAVATFEIAD